MLFFRPAEPPAAYRVEGAIATLLAAAAIVLTGAPPAAAEYKTTTSQALAAHAEWLPYAPPPEHGAAAVCLVDTGVDLNPDTAPNLVDRIALDGGDPSDTSPSKHGTQMAMIMGAPINDWGMVGFWPGVRIVSVRVSRPGSSEVPLVSYTAGLRACQERFSDHAIRVIEMAFSGTTPASDAERADFTRAVARARELGVNVIAAAGNASDGARYPAAAPGVLSVGANGPDDRQCEFPQPEVPDLLAPGCQIDEAESLAGQWRAGEGTSQASAIAATALAALRSYRPDLSYTDAETLIRRVDADTSSAGSLNARGTFLSSRLEGVIAIAEAVRSTRVSVRRRTARPRATRVRLRRQNRQVLVRVVSQSRLGRFEIRLFNRRRRLVRRQGISVDRDVRVPASVVRACVARRSRGVPRPVLHCATLFE